MSRLHSSSDGHERRHVAGPIWAIDAADGATYAKDGRPVWPFRNAREREALERMVATLDHRMEIIADATRCTLDGPGVVVGLGPRAFEDARLYAHLTLRRYEPAPTREALATMPTPSVVVTTFDHVDEELLDLLYDGRPSEQAPGLIFAFSDDDLRAQVLARSATLYCPARPAKTRRLELLPQLAVGRAEAEDLVVLGGNATPEQLREALAARPNLLTISTHSDGIDAQLLPALVFCPMDRVPDDHDPALAPSCHLTGFCHRRGRPIVQALAEGSLLSPSAVSADVMIHGVCWGLYPSPGVQSSAWSLSRRLIEELNVGALMTTWEIVTRTTNTTTELHHNVACGMPLGRALAIHHAAPESLRNGHRMCLVGDPELRLAPSDHADPLGLVEDHRPSQGARVEHVAALALLRGMVMQGRRTQRPDRSDSSSAAMSAVLGYELALLEGAPLEGDDDEPGPTLRRRIVEYFAERYTDSSRYWMSFIAETRTELARRPCPVCSRRIVSRHYGLRLTGASPRCHDHCPSCGPIADLPPGRELTLCVDPDGTIRLGGDLPHHHWDAQLVFDTQIPTMHATWPWPAAEDGAPVRRFRPTERWPQVPLRVALIMVRAECELNVVGCLCRVRSPSASVGHR